MPGLRDLHLGLCPTCHCFDISDETRATAAYGIRNWDSCMYPALHQGNVGAQPAGDPEAAVAPARDAQVPVLPDNFDAVGCVGCGRCVMLLPVNLDIRKIVTDISKL